MEPDRRHLFFGLMRVFKAEYLLMALMIVVLVIATFASPVGIKKLLE